ncbi:DUF1579 domain-containing protein [bacterium]|nr:MAG: DUF1579 domain-containing protein [bacterium]
MAMPPKAEPTEQHRFLTDLVGTWTYASEPIEEGTKVFTGTETVRTLGDVWILLEATGNGAQSDISSIMTLGYDPAKGRFVGSWIGNSTTEFWPYNGTLSEDRKVLTLASEGPSMSDEGKLGHYRDEFTFVSDDERVLKAYLQKENGEWEHFMTTRYRRTRLPSVARASLPAFRNSAK